MSRTLSIVGVFCTFFYLAALLLFFWDRLGEVYSLKLNEAGDLLAGIFGPIAILWLILGFFQQGIELRQNTEMLRLQAQELSNSVKQQQDLVDVSRRQFEADLDAMRYERKKDLEEVLPDLRFRDYQIAIDLVSGAEIFMATLENRGPTARNLAFYSHPRIALVDPGPMENFGVGEEMVLSWRLKDDYETPVDIMLEYKKHLGLNSAIEDGLRREFIAIKCFFDKHKNRDLEAIFEIFQQSDPTNVKKKSFFMRNVTYRYEHIV